MAKATGIGTGNGGKRRWTAAEDAFLFENYGDKSPGEIAAALGRTAHAVWEHARRTDCAQHRSDNYHPYFRHIDAPVKAYVLGLLAADGYVDDEGRIGIDLAVADQSAVALVRDQLCPSGRVRIYARKSRGTPRARFQVGSVGMARDLAALGIGPRKTHSLAWPERLPQVFDNSFICGYFDGDGHLNPVRGPYWTVCSATAGLLDVMRERISDATGVRMSRTYRQTSIWAISKYGEPVRALDAWIHRDVPGLARKRIPSNGQQVLL